MLEAIDLLKAHRRGVERLQPSHPELSKIDDLITYGQNLIDKGLYTELKSYIDFTSLPAIDNPVFSELAERINLTVGADMKDETRIHDLFFWEQEIKKSSPHVPILQMWADMHKSFTLGNRLRLSGAMGAIQRIHARLGFPVITLGDLRGTSPEEMAELREISYKRALFLLHSFAPRTQTPLNT